MNTLEVVRGGYGLCQLTAPRFLAGRVPGAPLTPGAVVVIRILGARQVVQMLATVCAHSTWVRRLSGGVDVLHALSMVGVALVSDKHRHAATADAAVATLFAVSEFRA